MSSIPPVTESAPVESTPPIRDRTPEQADIQRGITPVNRSGTAKSKIAPVAAGGFVVLALLWINLGGRDDTTTTNTMAMSETAKQRPNDTARQVATYVPGDAPTIANAATDPNAPSLTSTNLAPGTPGTTTLANGQVVPAIQPGAYPSNGQQGAPRGPSPAQTLAQASRRSPLLVFGSGEGSGTQQQGAGQPAGGGSVPDGVEGGVADAQQPGELDRLRQVSAIGESRATMMPNRNYLITAGTLIPCILQTAMNSTQPGYTSCIVPRDVFSENGRVVLLEKGTKVLGQYQGGLQQGQNRIFVVWTRATTPRGVAIDLGSPASDALGRAGMAGGVDTFFWARFGGALMLSLIDAGAQIGSSALSGRGSVNISQPSQAATQTLQQNQNIPPVLKKNQGEEVGIFVAKDFNFADVYGLSIK